MCSLHGLSQMCFPKIMMQSETKKKHVYVEKTKSTDHNLFHQNFTK